WACSGCGRRAEAGKPAIGQRLGARCNNSGPECRVMRGVLARRIRVGGIARPCERLAAAAAEIDLLPGTGAARLLHPFGTAVGRESRRVLPDLTQRMLLDVPELEPADALRRMA